MTKSPAFQFYPTDYLASQRVQLLTLEEEGAYWRALCYCWQHGTIPADPEKLARLIGKGGSTTLATTVATMFQPGEIPGTLIHDRLEAERAKQSAWREKSALGGQKSAEKRKGGSTTVPRVVEKCLQPKGNSSSPSSSPSSKSRACLDEVLTFCTEIAIPKSDAEWFFHKCEGNGWANGGKAIKDWRATLRSWKAGNYLPSQKTPGSNGQNPEKQRRFTVL